MFIFILVFVYNKNVQILDEFCTASVTCDATKLVSDEEPLTYVLLSIVTFHALYRDEFIVLNKITGNVEHYLEVFVHYELLL